MFSISPEERRNRPDTGGLHRKTGWEVRFTSRQLNKTKNLLAKKKK
jgi:hypothetical protein